MWWSKPLWIAHQMWHISSLCISPSLFLLHLLDISFLVAHKKAILLFWHHSSRDIAIQWPLKFWMKCQWDIRSWVTCGFGATNYWCLHWFWVPRWNGSGNVLRSFLLTVWKCQNLWKRQYELVSLFKGTGHTIAASKRENKRGKR